VKAIYDAKTAVKSHYIVYRIWRQGLDKIYKDFT